jgi:hypothetical protein
MQAASREQLRRYLRERREDAAGGLRKCVQHCEPPLVEIICKDDQAASFRWMRKKGPNGCVWWAVLYSQIIVLRKIRFHLHGSSRSVGLIVS